MSQGRITLEYVEAVADGIRYANGTENTYTPAQMGNAVRALKKTLVAKTVNANGEYNPASDNADGYGALTVNVQPNLQTKTATQNGTVTPDAGYDGLSSVVVNVSWGGNILLADNAYQTSGSGFIYDKTISIQEAGTYTIGVQAYTSNLTVKINDVAQALTMEVSGDYTRLYSATVSLSAGDVIDIYATSSGKSTVTAFIIKE